MAPANPEARGGSANDEPCSRAAGKSRRRRETSPATRALGLLVRREHSRQELTRKLIARGIAADEVGAAVARMAAEGWQDDGRFAASLARHRAGNGYGPLRIRAELKSHGLDGDTIAGAFAALADAGDDDWIALARDLVGRRFGMGATSDPALRRKAADLLIRRGFDGDTVRVAIRPVADD